MTQDLNTNFVWIGGSCNYGHKERDNSVSVKIVQYHKSPLLIETYDASTEAMKKVRIEYNGQCKKMQNEYKSQ